MAGSNWLDGQRVANDDTGVKGTVKAAGHLMKVTWDDGQTTYFDHHSPKNVRAISGEE